jgi:hypothetical protein
MSAHQAKFLKLRPEAIPGYIYLLEAVGTDKFKIGRATDVARRIRELQTGSPIRIRYVYHAYVHNANLCEMELHNKFSNQREIGEWFALTSGDVKSCIFLMRLIQEVEPVASTPEELAEATAEDELFVSMPVAVVRGEEKFTALQLDRDQATELIQKLRSELNQTHTIEKLWECKKGGSEAWKRAYAQFKNLTEEK